MTMRSISSDDRLSESETSVVEDQSVSIEGEYIFYSSFSYFTLVYYLGPLRKNVIKQPHIFIALKMLRYVYGVFLFTH